MSKSLIDVEAFLLYGKPMATLIPFRAIACSTTLEAEGLLSLLSPHSKVRWKNTGDSFVFVEEIGSSSIAFIVTGMNPKIAKRGLSSALEKLKNVESLVGFGSCGGLMKTVNAGDLVIPESVAFGSSKEIPSAEIRKKLIHKAEKPVWTKLITVDSVVSSPAEKAALFAATGCESVDMESAVWGSVCKELNIPWAILRVVWDSAEEVLPLEFSSMVNPYGKIRWLKAFSQMISKPGILSDVFRFSPRRFRELCLPAQSLFYHWLGIEEKSNRRNPTTQQ